MSELPGDKMGKVSDLKSVRWTFGGHSFGPCEVKDFQVLPLSNMIRSCLSRRWSFSSDVNGFSREFDKDLLEYVDECRHEMLAILATSRRRGLLVVEVDVRTIKANVGAGAKNGESVDISKEEIDLEKKGLQWDFSLDNEEGGDKEKRCLPWRFSGENLEAKVDNLEDVPDDSMIDVNDGAMSPISDFNPHNYKPVNVFDDFDNESANDDDSFNGIQNNANDFLREVNEVVNNAFTKTSCSSGVTADSFRHDDHNEDNLASNADEFLQMLNHVVDVVETEKRTDSTAGAENVTTNFAFGLLQENGLPWKLNLDPHENILEEFEDVNQVNSTEIYAEDTNVNKSLLVPHEEVPMNVNVEPSRNTIIFSESEDDSEAARQLVFVNSLLAQYKDNLDHVQHVLGVLATFEGDSAQTLHSMGMELFEETPTLLEQFFVAYPWARNPAIRGNALNLNATIAVMEQEGFGNLEDTDEIVEDSLSQDKDKCADSIKDLDEPASNEKSTRCKRKDIMNDVCEEPASKVRRKEVSNSAEEESYSSLDNDWMDKIGLLGWKPKPSPIQFSLQVLDENFGDELFHSKRSLEKTVFGKTIDQVNENEDDLTYLIVRQDERKDEEDLTDLIEDEDERKLKSVGARKLRSQKILTDKLVSVKRQSFKNDKKGNNKSRKNANSKLSTLKNNATELGKIPEETSSEMETTTVGESDETQQLENLSKCANDDLEKTFELGNSDRQTRRKRNTMFNFNNSGRKVKKRNSGRFKKNPKVSVIESTACQRINKRNDLYPGLFEKTSNKSVVANLSKNVGKSKVKHYRAMFENTSNEAVVEGAGNVNGIEPVDAPIEETENILADSTDRAIGDSLVDIMNELSDDTIDNSAANFMSEEVSEALMNDSVVKEVMSDLMDDIAEEEALTKRSLSEEKSSNENVDALERTKSNSTYVELNEDDWRSRTLTAQEISSIPFASPEEVSEYFSFERPRNPTPNTASTNFDFDLDLFDEVTASDCIQVNIDTGLEETSDLPQPSYVSQKLIKNTPINTSINLNQLNSMNAHQNCDFQRQLRAMSTDIPERTETPLSSRPGTALESDRSSSALSSGRDMPALDW